MVLRAGRRTDCGSCNANPNRAGIIRCGCATAGYRRRSVAATSWSRLATMLPASWATAGVSGLLGRRAAARARLLSAGQLLAHAAVDGAPEQGREAGVRPHNAAQLQQVHHQAGQLAQQVALGGRELAGRAVEEAKGADVVALGGAQVVAGVKMQAQLQNQGHVDAGRARFGSGLRIRPCRFAEWWPSTGFARGECVRGRPAGCRAL